MQQKSYMLPCQVFVDGLDLAEFWPAIIEDMLGTMDPDEAELTTNIFEGIFGGPVSEIVTNKEVLPSPDFCACEACDLL